MGNLFIVTAPSGAGKTSLVDALMASLPGIVRSVSHTTRAPRPGEVDGRDYHFVDAAQFRAMVAVDAFLEYAEVFGNAYGTAWQGVEQALAAERDMVLVIDWQGAANVRRRLPEAVSIFIAPPSLDELRRRLEGRGQDDAAVIESRLAEAGEDMRHVEEFDYLVVNDQFDQAVTDLVHIVSARRLERRQQLSRHRGLTEAWQLGQ